MHDEIGTGPDARGPALLIIDVQADHWAVRQIFDDPAGDHDWGISAVVDLAASDEAGSAVLRITDVGQLGDDRYLMPAISADATGPAARYNDGMSGVAIRAAGLTKRCVRALDGLDLEVGAGEVHASGGGPILLGLLRKDGGEVTLLGGDPWRLHRRLAYVPGDVTLWPSLTGGEIIDLLGRLRGGMDARRRKALTERFDLDTSKRARAYSRGNRQKVALIAALASGAELLLLEPTAGLDPLMEATFRDCVIEERHDGRTSCCRVTPGRGRGAVGPGDDHPRWQDG